MAAGPTLACAGAGVLLAVGGRLRPLYFVCY